MQTLLKISIYLNCFSKEKKKKLFQFAYLIWNRYWFENGILLFWPFRLKLFWCWVKFICLHFWKIQNDLQRIQTNENRNKCALNNFKIAFFLIKHKQPKKKQEDNVNEFGNEGSKMNHKSFKITQIENCSFSFLPSETLN